MCLVEVCQRVFSISLPHSGPGQLTDLRPKKLNLFSNFSIHGLFITEPELSTLIHMNTRLMKKKFKKKKKKKTQPGSRLPSLGPLWARSPQLRPPLSGTLSVGITIIVFKNTSALAPLVTSCSNHGWKKKIKKTKSESNWAPLPGFNQNPVPA
jgi:hypothetical protein